jgi:hypothetical protein
MSSQTARLWEAVLAALDCLADGANHSSESQLQDSVLYKNVKMSLGKVVCMPKAAWKRLVLDMQVRETTQHKLSTPQHDVAVTVC